MRIIGGEFKGRTLFSFEGEEIRPTPDKVREALFNIIRTRIYGARFMDLFSGTGAMGIEALSHGASEVHLNDKDRQSQALIKKNLDKLKISDRVKLTALDGVELIAQGIEKFDIIYIDPPYKAGLNLKAVQSAKNSLADNGVIILESESKFDGEVEGLIVTDERKYGRVHLTFFEKGEE